MVDFDNFVMPNDEKMLSDKFIPYNYCNYCEDTENPMNQVSDGSYVCMRCGYTKSMIGEHIGIDDLSDGMKIYSKTGNVFNINIDYSKTQKKQLMKELMALNNSPNISLLEKIDLHILRETVELYNKMQSMTIDKFGDIIEEAVNENGVIIDKSTDNTKKWVKRGGNKKEILGALIYYLHIKYEKTKQKQNIVKFMQFKSGGGLSKGLQVVDSLINKGKLPELLGISNIDNTLVYIKKYLTNLELNKDKETYERYIGFIIDIINETVRLRIGLTSYITSKIVGCIYLINKKCKLNISIDTIEQSCDNKRKNTITSFANAIDNPDTILNFYEIFQKYNIPIGIEGPIVKIKKHFNIIL
jgi:transcription initiation factor TFIIIB Brf1 subunit/transcription initiation factor TFIIB